MTDVKIVEKGVFRAYGKMLTIVLAIYGLILGAWFGYPKLKDWWESRSER